MASQLSYDARRLLQRWWPFLVPAAAAAWTIVSALIAGWWAVQQSKLESDKFFVQLTEAQKVRDEQLIEAQKARDDAREQAQKVRDEQLIEAQKARDDAREQAQKARDDAREEADLVRRIQAQQPSLAIDPTTAAFRLVPRPTPHPGRRRAARLP